MGAGRCWVDESVSPAGLVEGVSRWCLERMGLLNRDILAGKCSAGALKNDLAEVLARLPPAGTLTPVRAQQLVVVLGLAGASVGRHYQEACQAHRASPQEAFAGLLVGEAGMPFPEYFADVAGRTGTGHCARDSFASLVRWNVPAVQVQWRGEIIAALPSVFEDGLVRTYTGALDEQGFFGLLKASEVLEQAVNRELMPLSEGSLELSEDEALVRIARAVLLLDALRELNDDFADRPPGEGLRVDFFMDVFRQFAVHWVPGDIPPSGALDVEAVIRDLLVGIDLPSYPDHVRRVSPGLLAGERAVLSELMDRVCLPVAALELAQCAPGTLASMSSPEVHRLVARFPVLAALYLLLNAHARVAGVHLRLSKKFLFDPQRARDHAGLGDPGVVSNRAGTTGMDETRLDTFTRVRHHHVLAPIHVIPAAILETLARPTGTSPEAQREGVLVRFTGTSLRAYDLGLSHHAGTRPHGRPSALSALDQGEPGHPIFGWSE